MVRKVVNGNYQSEKYYQIEVCYQAQNVHIFLTNYMTITIHMTNFQIRVPAHSNAAHPPFLFL